MRKNALLLLLFHSIIFVLYGQTPSESSPITIQSSRLSVDEVLREISRQTGVDFSYHSKVLDKEKIISFSVEQASLEQTLKELSKKIQVTYTIIEGQVVFNSQKRKDLLVTISGFLTDRSTGETLIGAMVGLKEVGKGAFTNEFGYYSLSIKPGKYTVLYSHVGYERIEKTIDILQSKHRNAMLIQKSYELPTVVIKPPMQDILNKKLLGEMELSPDQLGNLPEFAGEPGLVNSLQSLPGIKSHADGSSYFYTRGGERDQNIIVIDDAPIYNPSHLFGFYSMLIPDFAKSITVHKSDMPANMGDQLSSIIDIRTKDGNLNKLEFSGSANPFVYRLSVETPIVKEKSAVFATLRRSNFGWVYKNQNPNLDIRFVDFHFKWNYKINDKNRLYYTAIWGSDFFQTDVQNPPSPGLLWVNFASTFRWNHIFNPKLFSNTTIYTGNYANRLFFPPNAWKSSLGTLSIKSDFTHYARPNFQSKFGIELQRYYSDPGSISLDSTIEILPSLFPNYARKSVLYYQGIWKPSNRLTVNAGARFISWANLGPTTYFSFDDTHEVQDTVNVGEGVYNRYTHLDPRLSLQYRLNESSQLKLSFGVYHQYIQMISNSISPFTPLELWLPASPNIRPQVSRQWALNYLKYFDEANMEISAALYHKQMWNQIDFDGHSLTYLNPLLEGELRFGKTRSYGLELFLKKDFGRVHGWMGYTYSRVFRQTDGINDGKVYPAFQDRPHDFSLFLHYQIVKLIECSVYWTSYSGSPFSSPTGFMSFNDQTVPIYGERNNDRLPNYHRMDFSLRFRLNKYADARFKHSVTLSINNFLIHRNVFAIKFNRLPSNNFLPQVPSNVFSQEQLGTTQVYLVRFFPSLTYRFNI